MNVQQLIERLSECDPAAEVLLAVQETYPLQLLMKGVADSDTLANEVECEAHDLTGCDVCLSDEPRVWLVDGGHPLDPYATPLLWKVASW